MQLLSIKLNKITFQAQDITGFNGPITTGAIQKKISKSINH